MIDEYVRRNGVIVICPSCKDELHVGNINANDLSRCGNCLDEIENCKYCQNSKGTMHPNHFASSRCESGRRNHCTCDTCF